jgi:septum site-determining protein MinD
LTEPTRIIGISSGKGGVGKTTVTANLALALGRLGKRVLMIDCNLSTPHLSYYLGVNDYSMTLNDIMKGRAKAEEPMYNYSYDGVWFLPASLNLKDLIGMDLRKFKRTVTKLAKPGTLDYILLDSAPGLGREAICVLNAADEILFVTAPYVPMVNDVLRSIEVLRQLGKKKVGIVLNMAGNKRHELFDSTVEKVTGVPVVGRIPYDRNMVYSLVMGDPILKHEAMSESSIAFMHMASKLSKVPYDEPDRLKRGIHKVRSRLKRNDIRMMQDEHDLESEIYLQSGQKNQKLKKLI